MYARASASQFLPHNSAASQSLVVVSMQMEKKMPILKRSRMVPFLSGWGHRKGGLGGGRQGGPAQNLDPPRPLVFTPSWSSLWKLRKSVTCKSSEFVCTTEAAASPQQTASHPASRSLASA